MLLRSSVSPVLFLTAGTERALLAFMVGLLGLNMSAHAQGSEDFQNLPANASSYSSRSWTGTDGVTWTATEARTDQTLNERAICFSNSNTRRVTSPVYANGMGQLTFNYVRAFTGTNARSLSVFVNNVQYGGTITVDPNSSTVASATLNIDVPGNVQLEIRATGAQIIIDDISWTAYTGQTQISFELDNRTVAEDVGIIPVNLRITPALAADATIVLNVAPGAGATYGVEGDFITVPGMTGNQISVFVPAGATTARFDLYVLDDLLQEAAENIVFSIGSIPTEAAIGSPNSFTLTISANDAPITTFQPGDIYFLGFTSHACGSNDDEISFVSFKDIPTGTVFDITDHGITGHNGTSYSFRDDEGRIRVTRSGTSIPAGTIITWRFSNAGIIAVSPSTGWGSSGISGSVNLASQDQFFIMANGSWSSNQYSGQVIAALNTRGTVWNSAGDANNSLFPVDLNCSHFRQQNGNAQKYTGPLTGTRSRWEWVKLFNDPANWGSGYSDCTQYANAGPNYRSGLSISIAPTPANPHRFTGVVNDDWHQCKNWEGRKVPSLTRGALVDGFSLEDPESNAPASAHYLDVRSHTDDRYVWSTNDLSILGKLRIGGDGPFENGLAVGNSFHLSVGDSVILDARNVGTSLLWVADNAQADLRGHVALRGGATWNADAGTTARFHGNITNSNGAGSLLLGQSHFVGSTAQLLQQASDTVRMEALHMENAAGLTLQAPVNVRTTLALNSGVVNSESSLLVLRETGNIVGGSDASHVEGPLQRLGDISPSLYPVGAAGHYAPVVLDDFDQVLGLISFTVRYHRASPRAAFSGDDMDARLDHISDCEYWTIDRSRGAAHARVGLSYSNVRSCGVGDPNDLRVARWNGAMWEYSELGTGTPGYTFTSDRATAFSPWTLGSTSGANPLPVDWLYMDAIVGNNSVDVRWRTGMERENAFFTVERGRSSNAMLRVMDLPAVGHSGRVSTYNWVDTAPLPGWSYYRVRQTDTDGRSSSTQSVAVHFNAGNTLSLAMEADDLLVRYNTEQPRLFQLLDVNGRTVQHGLLGSGSEHRLYLGGLPHGVYMLKLAGVTDGWRFVR